jgi:hypothetical protein
MKSPYLGEPSGGLPTTNELYQCVKRHVGEYGELLPGCRSRCSTVLFPRGDALTIPKLRVLARRCAGGVPQVPQFLGFLRNPQKRVPHKPQSCVDWAGGMHGSLRLRISHQRGSTTICEAHGYPPLPSTRCVRFCILRGAATEGPHGE